MGADGALEEAAAHGPLVQSAALDALKKMVADHPEWTDAQIATAIANAGGQIFSSSWARTGVVSRRCFEAVPSR